MNLSNLLSNTVSCYFWETRPGFFHAATIKQNLLIKSRSAEYSKIKQKRRNKITTTKIVNIYFILLWQRELHFRKKCAFYFEEELQ